MAQAVGRSPPAAEARFRFQVSPLEICCWQGGSDRSFSSCFSFPLSVSFHQCSILICVYISLLREGEMDGAGSLLRQCSFGTRVALGRRYPHFSFRPSTFKRVNRTSNFKRVLWNLSYMAERHLPENCPMQLVPHDLEGLKPALFLVALAYATDRIRFCVFSPSIVM